MQVTAALSEVKRLHEAGQPKIEVPVVPEAVDKAVKQQTDGWELVWHRHCGRAGRAMDHPARESHPGRGGDMIAIILSPPRPRVGRSRSCRLSHGPVMAPRLPAGRCERAHRHPHEIR